MEPNQIKAVYFIGAGGIGMSALERYFLRRGTVVAGYDRTPSALTRDLEAEGALIHYEESVEAIPAACRDRDHTLVVYTPAIPADMPELAYFRSEGFEVIKRAQLLGTLTRSHRGLCVAGTHGKTTTSTMAAHILHNGHTDCNAFLGGISKNLHSNYILADSDYVVIEADEFDRSFHHLTPWVSVITATDADHLDIYGTEEAYLESFAHYSSLIKPGGALIIHQGLKMRPRLQQGVRLYDYSRDSGDFHAANIRIDDGEISFDFVSPIESVSGIRLGQPIPINIDNGVAAMAMAQLAGATPEELRRGMLTFEGVERRFDFKIRTKDHVLLSDYAHHPEEIRASALSLRQVYPHRKLTAIFQPHLYTRTRDFHREFAASLSIFDEVVLCPIYPARELPIEGVTSKIIYDRLEPQVARHMVGLDGVADWIRANPTDVVVVLGAGDLDNRCPEIAEAIAGN